MIADFVIIGDDIFSSQSLEKRNYEWWLVTIIAFTLLVRETITTLVSFESEKSGTTPMQLSAGAPSPKGDGFAGD